MNTFCELSDKMRDTLAGIMEKLGMSASATHRVIKVARTIADFGEQEKISEQNLMEAISYRRVQHLNSILK